MPSKMLERVLSVRRAVLPRSDATSSVEFENFNDEATADAADDDEKAKKQQHQQIRIATRAAANYLTRMGPFGLCLVFLSLAFLSILSLYLFHSRSFVCVSSYDPLTRSGFFGLDGLKSDFGFLGVPWCRSKHGKTVEWTSKDLIKGLEEFVPIYETRPIKNNTYGMGFDHSFGLWFIARWLKPDLMIESGVLKGHSTWVLRQAMPDTPIVSLSPRHPEKYLKKGPAYVDGNCTYFAGKDFVDFGSVDWGSVMKKHEITDLSRVLIFFDDHQNELKRIKQALKAGFQHLVFEDNYDTGTGDIYSVRQICDQFYIRVYFSSSGTSFPCKSKEEDEVLGSRPRRCPWNLTLFFGGGHSCCKDSDEARIRSKRRKFWQKAVDIEHLCGPDEAWWGVRGYMRDDFNHSNQPISYADHFHNSRFLESVLDVYWELPPVAGPSLTHQTRYDPARVPSPIVEDGQYRLFQRLGLTGLETSVFNGYTQMVYLHISGQES